ncbi:hypothetical protein WBG78_04930 [Chryseolinea sp. T2]|uniref:hypothetical protein n=1 Tax=Chryseolinea sp. T2 TaxID=3129255 RepID=UPI00307700F4
MTNDEIIGLIPEYLEGTLATSVRLAIDEACEHNPDLKREILAFKEMSTLLESAALRHKVKQYHQTYLKSYPPIDIPPASSNTVDEKH